MTERRPGLLLAVALAAAVGCSADEIQTITRNLERPWDVALVCAMEDEAGHWRGAPMTDCGEGGDGSLHAFVVQSTPGTLAAINLRMETQLDLDPREPLHSSVEIGDLPNSIDAAPDGSLVLVANLGDPPPDAAPGSPNPGGSPYLTAIDPADVLPSLAARPKQIYLPAPASSVLFLDAETAVVALPSLSSVALVRISDPVEDSVVDVPLSLGTIPDPDGGEAIEALPTPWSLAIDAGRGRILVGDRGRGKLAVLARGTGGALVLLEVVDLTGSPVSIAVEPPGWGPEGTEAGRWIYAASGATGGVMVLDAATLEAIDISAGDPMEWRSEIVVSGMVKDVLIGRVQLASPPELSQPSVLQGTFAFLITSKGEAVVVDIQDDDPHGRTDDDGPRCWTGSVPGEGDYACPRHVLRSGVAPPSTPYWNGQPVLNLPGGAPVVFGPEGPDAAYPRFADWDAVDAATPPRPTYGVSFDPDERRAVNQAWSLEFEGTIPWTDGVGGNVEPGGILSDRAMPFCSRGVLGAAGGYEGDRLIVLDDPDPLSGSDAGCAAFVTPPNPADPDRRVTEYRIADAFQDRLVLAEIPGGAPLPTEECFPYAVRYEIRAPQQWLVLGGSVGFLHHVVADAGGRCVEEPADCATSEDPPFRCMHVGRASEGAAFRNPYVSFTMTSGTSPTARGLRYELSAKGGFTPLAEDVGVLPVAGALDTTGRTGPALLVVDSSSDGLVRVDLDGFSRSDNWE